MGKSRCHNLYKITATKEKKKALTLPPPEPTWQESAGSLLLLAAATETNLLSTFSQAIPAKASPCHSPRRRSGLTSQQMLLLTLLFLGVVGLHRIWDLRSYTGEGLALLTGRKRAYSYRYTEDFLTYLVGCHSSIDG